MEMSPSPFLWILMVPCFSSSWIFFSSLVCLWMASSFSFNICRSEVTCELVSLYTSCAGRDENRGDICSVSGKWNSQEFWKLFKIQWQT